MIGHIKKKRGERILQRVPILTTYIIQLTFYLLHFLPIICSFFCLVINPSYLLMHFKVHLSCQWSFLEILQHACCSLVFKVFSYDFFLIGKFTYKETYTSCVDKCIHLCNPKCHHETEYYHPFRKFLMSLLSKSLPYPLGETLF